MKYRLDVPLTVQRDFAHQRPAPLPSYDRVIAGLLVFVGCMSWPVLILTLGG